MDSNKELLNEFLPIFEEDCGCGGKSKTDYSAPEGLVTSMGFGALSQLEVEIFGDESGELLTPELLEEAAFEAELALEGERLEEGFEAEFETEEFETELLVDDELSFAEWESDSGEDAPGLESFIEAAKTYPGLKITLSF